MGSSTAFIKAYSLCLLFAVLAIATIPTLARASTSCIYDTDSDEDENWFLNGGNLPPDDRHIKVCPGFSGPDAPRVCNVHVACFDNTKPEKGNTWGWVNCRITATQPHCPLSVLDCVAMPGCPAPPSPQQGLKPTSLRTDPIQVERMTKALQQAQ